MIQSTDPKVQRLIRVAKHWASFQDGDSLEDQRTDSHLQGDAIEAREALLDAINEMPS